MASALGRMLRSGLSAGRGILMPAAPKPLASFKFQHLSTPRLLSTRVSAKQQAVPEIDEDEYEDDYGMAMGSAAVQRRVLKLREFQEQYDTINREYLKELALLQTKYAKQYAPVFDQRKEVVLGKTPVDKYDVEDDGEEDTGIPEFWLTALLNHEKVGPFITERDEEVLKHLVDVRSEVLLGDDRGFSLTFTFQDNQFMENKTLTKTYVLMPEEDVVPKEFKGCDIKWKSDAVNPTVQQKKKRVKSKEAGKGGKPAFVVELEPVESFFNLFDPAQVPNDPESLDDVELNAIQEELGVDFDIGYAVKEQIIPRAVEWFTGELAEPLDDEFDEGDLDEDLEDDMPPTPPPKGSRR